jgi:hypothetical protein
VLAAQISKPMVLNVNLLLLNINRLEKGAQCIGYNRRRIGVPLGVN